MEELGGYRLIEQLGSGGMGVVHLGMDGDSNPVAVKVLHPHIANDETARKRLGREVRTLRRIKHPRIAEVLDAELESERPFIVTEFVDGATLSDDVRENGPFAEDELVHFGHALLDALNAVHEAGVIHRDLKPANIMIMDGEPIIIDFGIAQAADEVKVTATGLVMGTPGYLSPEIADGKASSEKTDWWGWAASMAFAATGRNPYGSGPLEAVLGRVAMGRADLEGVPALFVPLLRACLDPRPERRPSGPMILDSLVDIESGRMPSLGGPLRQGPMTGQGAGASGAVGAAGPGGTSVMPAAVPGPGFGPVGPAAGAGAAHLGSPYRSGPAAHGVPRQAHPNHQQHRPVMQQPGPPHPGPQQLGVQQPVAQYGSPVGSGPRPYGPLGIDQAGQNQQLQQRPVQHSPVPPQQPHLVPPGPPRRRRGGGWAVLALNVLAIALTPLGPFIMLIAAYLWQIIARTAGSVAKTRNWRQFEQGPAATSVWSSVSAMPFAALRAVFTSLFSFILPLIAAVAVAILMRLDVMGIVPGGHSEQWALWAAGLTCAVVLWLGPGSTNLRHGSKVLFSGVTRSATGEWITVAILGALTVLAVITVLSGAAVSWWPVQSNPFALLPEPLL